mmetsp:Transcript_22127/g.48376  ORF Transcript_22127/g.48376 Transcript_22127/m.48376 type:complete len:256 (-) Transcript_22127:1487-2254(-)
MSRMLLIREKVKTDGRSATDCPSAEMAALTNAPAPELEDMKSKIVATTITGREYRTIGWILGCLQRGVKRGSTWRCRSRAQRRESSSGEVAPNAWPSEPSETAGKLWATTPAFGRPGAGAGVALLSKAGLLSRRALLMELWLWLWLWWSWSWLLLLLSLVLLVLLLSWRVVSPSNGTECCLRFRHLERMQLANWRQGIVARASRDKAPRSIPARKRFVESPALTKLDSGGGQVPGCCTASASCVFRASRAATAKV